MMVGTKHEWRADSVWLRKEISFLYVVVAFVTIPDHQIRGVTASTHYNNGRTDNTQGNTNRRYNYRVEGDDLYTPYNPLWREEQIYTGERRGPVSASDDRGSSLRRRRRADGISSPAHTPLAPHINDIDDVSSAITNPETYRPQQIPDGFPLQSADIGSNGVQSGNDRNFGFGTERRSRRWVFPIDFRRQKGKLNIGYSISDETRQQRQTQTPRGSKESTPGSSTVGDEESKGGATTTIQTFNAKRRRTTNKNDLQVSVSLDPFSSLTLLQNGLTGILGVGSVYVGTLKLLGPMILAKQCLTTVGSFLKTQNNKPYVRRAPTKQIRYVGNSNLNEFDTAIAVARAATRSLLQILCMSCAGRLIGFVLDQTPCLLRPFWVCQWWYGVVWLASIYAVGSVFQEYVVGYLAQTNNKFCAFAAIQPASEPMGYDFRINSINDQDRRRTMISPLPSCLDRMMKGPREGESRPLRIAPLWQDRKYYDRNRKLIAVGEDANNVKLDPLLFPSTWKPLSFVTFLALSRAICRSFCTNLSSTGLVEKLGDACRENNQYLIMRSFIIQKTLYSEWHRVFGQERRVALGAGVGVIGLLALMWNIYSVSTVDPYAAMAIVPILMTRMISTWVNLLLSYNGFGRSPETMTWRDMASHFNRI